MFDSEHKYAIDYGTRIALSDACSAPYLSLIYIYCLHIYASCQLKFASKAEIFLHKKCVPTDALTTEICVQI